jgi:hypothetical protein
MLLLVRRFSPKNQISFWVGMAAYDGNYYLIHNEHIFSNTQAKGASEDMSFVVKYIKALYQLEMYDNVWN